MGVFAIFFVVFVDLHVCYVTHNRDERSEIIAVRCCALAPSETAGLWPAAVGSLSLRRSPCIRENCPACLSGEQHPSHVLYGRLKGRRVSVYVPEELVPEVRRCLDNGRALQELLYEAAPRYVKALKRERAKAAKSKKSRAERVASGGSQISFADWELMRQGVRLEPLLQAISDFLDDQQELVERVRRRSACAA